MRLLLDTHYAYGLAGDYLGFSARESRYFDTTRDRFVLSAVSIWEMRIKWASKHRSGARKGPIDPALALQTLRSQPLDYLDLTPDHAAARLAVPLAHRDPFDELLLVQAQAEGLLLLTRDEELLKHPLARAVD